MNVKVFLVESDGKNVLLEYDEQNHSYSLPTHDKGVAADFVIRALKSSHSLFIKLSKFNSFTERKLQGKKVVAFSQIASIEEIDVQTKHIIQRAILRLKKENKNESFEVCE